MLQAQHQRDQTATPMSEVQDRVMQTPHQVVRLEIHQALDRVARLQVQDQAVRLRVRDQVVRLRVRDQVVRLQVQDRVVLRLVQDQVHQVREVPRHRQDRDHRVLLREVVGLVEAALGEVLVGDLLGALLAEVAQEEVQEDHQAVQEAADHKKIEEICE